MERSGWLRAAVIFCCLFSVSFGIGKISLSNHCVLVKRVCFTKESMAFNLNTCIAFVSGVRKGNSIVSGVRKGNSMVHLCAGCYC